MTRDAYLRRTWGITEEEYLRLLAFQDGRCAICRNRPRTQSLAVDHDHLTGAIRGLLCKRCNHGLLGGAHDNIGILERAINYLLSPPALRANVRSAKVTEPTQPRRKTDGTGNRTQRRPEQPVERPQSA